MKAKKVIVPAIVLGVLLFTGVLGISRVKADESDNYPPIIQKLVERFNLDAEEVKQVFDEVRQERQEQRRAQFEERLDQAVEGGKITEEQKQAILTKKEEMQANYEEWRSLTPEERLEKMKSHREEMKNWADANGIDLSLLPMLLGEGHRGGFGRPGFGE